MSAAGDGRATALYRRLLVLYPRRFRRAYGEEMAWVLSRRLRRERRRGRLAATRFLLYSLTDLAVSAARLRLAAGRGERLAAPRRQPDAAAVGGRRNDAMLQDLRYALRTLRRSPGFTAVALVTLALGIGANAAVFSLVDAYLLRPFPFPAADELVTVHSTVERMGIDQGQFSLLDHRDVAARSSTLASFALWRQSTANLAGAGDPVRVPGALVTADFFPLLGVRPIVGRVFTAAEAVAGGERVAVLSEGLWRDRFAADPAVVGRTVDLDGEPHTVIGVVPRGSEVPDNARLWRPLTADPDDDPRYRRTYWGLGRLADGVGLDRARAELAGLAAGLRREHPDTNRDIGMTAVSLREYRVGSTRRGLGVLSGAAVLLLLIVCANVANLLLARGSLRRRELAARAALGAGRGRLLRQLLTETLLLTVAGAALGLAVGRAALAALLAATPVPLPAWLEVGVDGRSFLFASLLAVVAALLAGLLPAWRGTGGDLASALRSGLGRGSAGRSGSRLRSALVVGEVALAAVLLVAAGLTVASLTRLSRVDPGFRAEGALTASVRLPPVRYPEAADRVGLARRLSERAAALPGVEVVGTAAMLPLRGSAYTALQAEWQSPEQAQANPHVHFNPAGPGLFRALGVPRVAGRVFTDADDLQAPRVAVVNQRLAALLWPGEPAVGRRFKTSGDEEWTTVVGVVGDIRQVALDQPADLQLYLPYAQDPWSILSLVVRTAGPPEALLAEVRATVAELDPGLAVTDLGSLESLVAESTWRQRFLALQVWVFGAVSLLLAAVGVFGLLSYAVARRRREIGIRMALGAQRGRVVGGVVRHGLGLVAIGLALGLGAAAAAGRLLQPLLYGVDAIEPGVYAAVAALFLAVAAAATSLPARRAARVDPAVTLRAE